MNGGVRRIFALWIVLFGMLVASPLRAETRSIVVGELEGDSAAAVRDALLVGLAGKGELRLVALDHAKTTADRVGADLADTGGVKKVAGALGLTAFLDGKIESGKKWTAVIRVRNGASGEVSESVRFTADSKKALLAKLEETAYKQLGPALADAKAASSGGGGVAVGPFDGPKSATVRGYVVGALKKAKGVTLVADARVKQSGIKLNKKSSDEDYAGVAAATGASAVLSGKVTTKGRAYELELVVRNGADGSVIDSVTLEGKSLPALRTAINKELATEVEGPLSKAAPAEAPEEQVPEASAGDAESEGDAAAGDEAEGEEVEEDTAPAGRPSALEIGAGIRAFSRNFRYTDDINDALRSYKLGVAPAGFVYLRWYPVAHFDAGPLSHLGLTGGYEQGFAVSSEAPGGEKLDTTTREWWAGLRYRFPFDAHEAGVVVTYGKHSFEVDDDPANPLVPDVEYTYIRAGIDGRVRVARVVLGAQMGYRLLRDVGELGTDAWFPRVSGGAVDAGLVAGYEILDGLDLLAGFDFRRYFFSMNPEPGDARIAGGALDEFLSGWFGLAYRLPGQATAGDGAASISASTE